ncbi:MAG: flagellar biosynthetic protein FliQ [Labilithrix sp.]|nr:flagellar biosynthetic protein FliQ [Labilithrix sp.]
MDPTRLVVDALSTVAYVGGPLLAAALLAGIAVGLAQAVVQVNEASLSFIVKLVCVAAIIVALGSTLSASLIGYTRRCFTGIETVVR